MNPKSATTVWKKECNDGSIVTSCRDLDNALSSGVQIGVITEFCGPPGSGKTAICYQLCVNVQLPADLNGKDGDAIFIDTNSGFKPDRLYEIATAQSVHCQNLYRTLHQTDQSVQSFVNKCMNGVKVYIVTDDVQLLTVIHNLKKVLKSSRNIRLIVIDSFTFLSHQMESAESTLDRTSLLCQTLKNLQKLANEFSCAVVITNEFTTRIDDVNSYCFVPAMGDSHGHQVNQLITLGQRDVRSEVFCASIDKARHTSRTLVKFRITKDGIREV